MVLAPPRGSVAVRSRYPDAAMEHTRHESAPVTPPEESARPGRGVRRLLAAVLVLAAVAARVGIGTIGLNHDVLSWVVVSGVVERGENVYAATDRYNYGPVWSWVVFDLARLAEGSGDPGQAFPVLLSLFLALVDVAIAGLLWRRCGGLTAAFFLLNPVSILVTGFGRQFGNLAVLAGLAAATALEQDGAGVGSTARAWGASALLGLSLAVKHLLFAFPAWLAVRRGPLRRRLVLLLAPPTLFLLAFVPYWGEGHAGIVRNVLLYRSFSNAPLWHLIVPRPLAPALTPMVFFIAALAGFGLAARRLPPMRSLLLYTAVLVAFSPALANQYLAIPIAFCAVWRNPLTLLYSALATVYLAAGLNLAGLQRVVDPATVGYALQTAVLAAAAVWALWGEPLGRGGRQAAATLAHRLGAP